MSTKKVEGDMSSLPYRGAVYDRGNKAMIQLQSRLRDYHDLHKDVEVSRNKLENVKRKRLILQAEVRFLRRRYKYLLKTKYSELSQGGKEPTQPHNEKNQRKNSKQVPIASQKKTIRGNLPPVFRANQKGKALVGQQVSLKSTVPSSGKNAALGNHIMINPRVRSYKGGMESIHLKPMQDIDMNQQEKISSGNGSAMPSTASMSELNNWASALSGKQQVMLNRAPALDLNQISKEEDDLQDNYERVRFEDLKKGLINEDQRSDLKLSACRNVGDNPSRAAKRKISWQDPVALRV